MNRVIASTMAVCLAMVLAVSTVSAAVVNPTLPINVIDPPASVASGGLESDAYIQVFAEQTSFKLPGNVAVDFTAPGTYDAWADVPATTPAIAAGTWVDSYYVHTDQEDRLDSKVFNGTITFDQPILGVMVRGATLAGSNAMLGAAGTTYPDGGGLELSSCRDIIQDCVAFTAPATLVIKLTTWNVTDSIRVITQAVAPVSIDVKPGSDPNCFNNDGHGVIPVAILGSMTIDATAIDPASVSLEGLAVKAVGKGNRLLASLEDVNNDGFQDMVVQIQDIDGAFTSGSTIATLTGRFTNGGPFSGTDTICVVPAGA